MKKNLLVVAAIAAVALLAAACGESVPTGSAGGEGAGGPATSQLCIDLYSPGSLAEREVAFDGTVKAVSGNEVTFEVNEWFKGGDSAEITMEGAAAIGDLSSVGDVDITLDTGERLLVAGDENFVWACGFTQPYTASAAAEWKAAVA